MSRRMIRGALAGSVTIAALAGGAGAAVPVSAVTVSAATVPAWQVTHWIPGGTALVNVAAINPHDAYVAGWYRGRHRSALLLHWNGASWSPVALPDPVKLGAIGVAASGPDNVWVFGASKTLRWNGHHWLTIPQPQQTLPGTPDPSGDISVLGSADVWELGGSNPFSRGTVIDHWNGRSWTTSVIKDLQGEALSASSPRNVWVAGFRGSLSVTDGAVAILRWDKKRWQSVRMPHVDTEVISLAAVSTSGVWVGTEATVPPPARGKVLHYSGRGWSQSTPAPQDPSPHGGFASDGAYGVFDGPYAHWTGSSWISAMPNPDSPGYVYMNFDGLALTPGTHQLWGVGYDATDTGHSLIASYGA
jgi:hypothetical protein